MSNYSVNKVEIDRFLKDIRDLDSQRFKEIERKTLNKSANEGLRYAKLNTVVRTGWLRKSWGKAPTVAKNGGYETEIYNTADYALYWNNGHRIVRNGVTYGFVKGSHFLERVQVKITDYMIRNLKNELEKLIK